MAEDIMNYKINISLISVFVNISHSNNPVTPGFFCYLVRIFGPDFVIAIVNSK